MPARDEDAEHSHHKWDETNREEKAQWGEIAVSAQYVEAADGDVADQAFYNSRLTALVVRNVCGYGTNAHAFGGNNLE